jgi:hypothetical protein
MAQLSPKGHRSSPASVRYGLPTVVETCTSTAHRRGQRLRLENRTVEPVQLTVEEAGNPLPLWRKEPRQEGVTTHCHYASSHQADAPTQGAIRAVNASLARWMEEEPLRPLDGVSHARGKAVPTKRSQTPLEQGAT